MEEAVTVQQTNKYDKFKLIHNNRDQNRGHIERLKRAFEEVGNLTQVQPILVNEKMEIIDGQHRFIAAKELGQPIFYTKRAGLRISDARSMNILHRTWTTDDFAESYAAGGDPNYQKYLKIKEDYGLSHSIILSYIAGANNKGAFGGFRNGEFVLTDEADARHRLDMLMELLVLLPIGKDKNFSYAFLKTTYVPGYDHDRMVDKATRLGDTMRRYATVPEYQRALEDLYNHGHSESTRVRLY